MTGKTSAPIDRVSMEVTETSTWLRILRAARDTTPIFLILLALLVAIHIQSPAYNLVSIFKNGAPLAILAAGQLFVIVSGEFDLSVGSLITVVVTMSASISKGDPDKTLMVFGVMILLGIAVGLVNGLVVTRLHVPSFVATLGMMLILLGGVNYITGGTPLGDLPSNFRTFGRDEIKNFPVLGTLPNSIIVLIVAGVVMYWLLHRANFGRQIYAVGGNARAADLAGIDVAGVRNAGLHCLGPLRRRCRDPSWRLRRCVGASRQGLRVPGHLRRLHWRSGPHGRSGLSSRGDRRRSDDAGPVRASERARLPTGAPRHRPGRDRDRGRRIRLLSLQKGQLEKEASRQRLVNSW